MSHIYVFVCVWACERVCVHAAQWQRVPVCARCVYVCSARYTAKYVIWVTDSQANWTFESKTDVYADSIILALTSRIFNFFFFQTEKNKWRKKQWMFVFNRLVIRIFELKKRSRKTVIDALAAPSCVVFCLFVGEHTNWNFKISNCLTFNDDAYVIKLQAITFHKHWLAVAGRASNCNKKNNGQIVFPLEFKIHCWMK